MVPLSSGFLKLRTPNFENYPYSAPYRSRVGTSKEALIDLFKEP